MDIAVFGGNGRIGTEIINLCDISEQHNISFAVVRDTTKAAKNSHIKYVNLADVNNQSSDLNPAVVIDFSHPNALEQAIKLCSSNYIPLLVGTTALSTDNDQAIAELAQHVPVMLASNTSIAVHQLMAKIVDVGKFFDQQNDLKRVILEETHRLGKRDTPSGTALMISQRLAHVVNKPIEIISHRAPQAIATHRITLDLGSEMLHFSHQALSRECFAQGAIRLAQWLITQSVGQHSVDDFLLDIARERS